MNKTIVNIERISGCFPELNIAKSGFYNFESDAFNHSATLPTAYYQAFKTHLQFDIAFVKDSVAAPKDLWLKMPYANLVRYVPSGIYFSRIRVRGKLIRRSLKTNKLSVAKLRPSWAKKTKWEISEKIIDRVSLDDL